MALDLACFFSSGVTFLALLGILKTEGLAVWFCFAALVDEIGGVVGKIGVLRNIRACDSVVLVRRGD